MGSRFEPAVNGRRSSGTAMSSGTSRRMGRRRTGSVGMVGAVADAVTEPALLSSTERAALRAELIVERGRAEHRLVSLRRSVDELVDAADLEPPDDEHDPDGTTAYERAQVISLAGETTTVLEVLDRALESMSRASTPAPTAGCPSASLA